MDLLRALVVVTEYTPSSPPHVVAREYVPSSTSPEPARLVLSEYTPAVLPQPVELFREGRQKRKKIANNSSSSSRRNRPVQSHPPFNFMMRSVTGEGMRVNLEIPTPEEQCPLTLSPIADDELDFLPGVTVLASMPTVRRLTLPCGHAFGAMNVIYHFARRDMRCPCCRAGFKCELDVDYVPVHFRAALADRIRQCNREDMDEQTDMDERIARALGQDDILSVFNVLNGATVNMTVYVHAELRAEAPSMSLEFTLVQDSREGGVFNLRSSVDRRVLQSVFDDESVQYVSLVTHMQTSHRVIELARTGPFLTRAPPPWEGGVFRIVHAGNSCFDIFPLGNFSGENPFIRWRM